MAVQSYNIVKAAARPKSLSRAHQPNLVVEVLVVPVDIAIEESDVPREIGIAGVGRRRPKPMVRGIRKGIEVDGRALVFTQAVTALQFVTNPERSAIATQASGTLLPR